MRARVKRFMQLSATMMGPGFLAAMADNDAGGIAMYMQAGAQYGYAVLVAVLVSIVCLMICQDMAARMGIVGGQGLAALIREQYGVRVALFTVALLLVANLMTTVSEFVGIAIAGKLLGIEAWIAVLIAGAVLTGMAIGCRYRMIERILFVMCLSFGAYLAGGYVALPEVREVWDGIGAVDYGGASFWLMAVGVIGTTVTPWGQFYLQSSLVDKGLDDRAYGYVRADVWLGSFFTGMIALAIVCMGAQVFWQEGIAYTSLLQSVDALSVLFGDWANILFGAGLVGASLLAAFILPLSTAYAVCEVLGAEYGLDRSLGEAPVFFAVYLFVLVGGMIGALGVDISPLELIVGAQIVNGLLLLPILFATVLLVQDPNVMGSYVNGTWQDRAALFVLFVLAVAQGGLFLTI